MRLSFGLAVLVSCGHAADSKPTCVDEHTNCGYWAGSGECESNPAFMERECAVACGTCWKKTYSCDQIGDDAHVNGDLTRIFTRMLTFSDYNPKLLSSDPWVVSLESFISETEAQEVLRVAGHKFERSMAGFKDGHVSARTSSTSWCNVPSCENDDIMMWLKRRITSMLDVPMKNTEHLQTLRYEPGQFYRAHHDQNSPYDSPAGPRVFTFFLYLSNVTRGGETRFPQLDLAVAPKPGAAVVWASVRDDDLYRDDHRTEHEAMTVGPSAQAQPGDISLAMPARNTSPSHAQIHGAGDRGRQVRHQLLDAPARLPDAPCAAVTFSPFHARPIWTHPIRSARLLPSSRPDLF